MTAQNEGSAQSDTGAILFGVIVGIFLTLACGFLYNGITSQGPEAISFTVIDHDESDHSVYTTDGEILTTNRYQWKRIELNKTYNCYEGPWDTFDNCHETGGI